MRNRSIVTKIVLSVCGIVSVLMLAGVFVLMKFEVNLVETFRTEHLEKINRTIDERGQGEKSSLKNNVVFSAEILKEMGGSLMYRMNIEDLNQLLHIYMKSPVIRAVKVLDESDSPFTAIWKAPEVTGGQSFPDSLELDETLSLHLDYRRKEKKIGSFHIYYTNNSLIEKINTIREKAIAETEIFNKVLKKSLDKALAGQGIGVFIILLTLTICLIFSLRALILNPLLTVSNIARRLADFDLTVSVKTDRRDEIGMLLIAINNMVSEFRKITRDVKAGGKELADSSAQMTENIGTIASSAEEISANVQNISETTDQMSQNVNAVASSIEEMSASVTEVGENARQGSDIAEEAVEMAKKAGNTMKSLGEAANRIGEITEVIKKIADKTNLLALNAHIEAASAGEAGKGFAVVANEIKEFARQSAQAAEDIAKRISVMQESTEAAVTVICDVSDIINNISQTSESISFTLEEQMKAANEIASNMAQANERANNIAFSMEDLAKGANEVSMNVGMAAGSEVTDSDTQDRHIDTSAVRVARLAKALLELVDKFKVDDSPQI